jgi:hypothetical protein
MEPLFRIGHDASTGETWQEEIPAEELANIPESVFVYEQSVADDLVEGEQP